MKRCPECGVAFHTGCWIENHGCSSYGCKQVGILRPKPLLPSEEVLPAPQPTLNDEKATPLEAEVQPHRVQWGYLLLPASFLAGLASLFTFGAPSLFLALSVILFELRRKGPRRKLSAAVLIVSMIAAAAGSGFSTYWWLAAPAGRLFRP
jgi:hypothetical protein